MAAIVAGAIAGLILSCTTSYVIVGLLFHDYQRRTPLTWRRESWQQHAVAIVIYSLAGVGLGWLFALVGAPPVGLRLFELAAAACCVVVPCILLQAVYVNWHVGFVVGLSLDWAIFIVGVLLACAWLGR